jgi:hypothetical protein
MTDPLYVFFVPCLSGLNLNKVCRLKLALMFFRFSWAPQLEKSVQNYATPTFSKVSFKTRSSQLNVFTNNYSCAQHIKFFFQILLSL